VRGYHRRGARCTYRPSGSIAWAAACPLVESDPGFRVARVLGVQVVSVTIRNVRTRYRANDDAAHVGEAVIALAGACAERQSKLLPDGQTDLWDTAWNSDFTNALTHLRTIGGSIDDTLDRADRIVRLHWEAIKQVAEMLDEHDSVSGEQVDAVLAQTCGGSYPG
jgi:hypothetical protein